MHTFFAATNKFWYFFRALFFCRLRYINWRVITRCTNTTKMQYWIAKERYKRAISPRNVLVLCVQTLAPVAVKNLWQTYYHQHREVQSEARDQRGGRIVGSACGGVAKNESMCPVIINADGLDESKRFEWYTCGCPNGQGCQFQTWLHQRRRVTTSYYCNLPGVILQLHEGNAQSQHHKIIHWYAGQTVCTSMCVLACVYVLVCVCVCVCVSIVIMHVFGFPQIHPSQIRLLIQEYDVKPSL